ncbi:MAG: hypothetical protein E7Z81_07400 [Methanobrevibacter sp.]|uniref:hypothetical protein n=1 Tax=Methanobrevibacter sp. TaxID=66852 RepID=UPI0025E2847F|nr:hypothetical protein [Methanobrevibacter sp.]MBE6498086.1 hypothetical protein [Methanobrevibacter sp.]
MNFMNDGANIKQFGMINYVNEKSNDDHVISKISIVLRSDKIEAPYYMDTKIRMSSCIDMPENGIIHAMDIVNHHRMYNLTEEKYNIIKSLILDIREDEQVKIFKKEDRIKAVFTSKNADEMESLFKSYGELFGAIDGLVS